MNTGIRNIFVFSLAVILIASEAFAVPSYDRVRQTYQRSDALLLDRNGKIMDELRVDPGGRRLDWILLKDISPALTGAVLYCEDRNFYRHHGVDWKALGSALLHNLFSGRSRGASTITMQVASRLEGKLRPRAVKRSLNQKWAQIRLAGEIEATWRKDEILETYLNLVVFRGELQGIAAASRGLFGKEASGLDDSESMLLACLIRAPNAQAEEVAARACSISESRGLPLCGAIREKALSALNGPYRMRPGLSIAPHVARMLLDSRRGGAASTHAVSTLDRGLQQFSLEALQQQLIALRNKHVADGAVLVLENRSGNILAYIGNGGRLSSSRYVDGVKAKRQAGSIIKPFLYEYALEKKIITAASLLDDSPLFVSTPVGLYEPHNYDDDFKGPVPVRSALASSLNIPAVRVLMLVEADEIVGRLGRLGLRDLRDGDHYGLSLALGSMDVSLFEMTNAYRALANGGEWSEPRLMPKGARPRPRPVMSRGGAFIVSDILADREARSLTFGFESPISTRFWTAVKTGTSKDMRDNWCIGYSQRYTVGVWVGNFSGESMRNVSGVTGAAPVWLEIMEYLHRRDASGSPPPPPGVVVGKIKTYGGSAERTEFFLAGTEPGGAAPLESRRGSFSERPRIVYPASGSVIAIDPDIPEANARVFFEATRPGLWVLNGTPIGSGSAVSWRPGQGRFTLTLSDEGNNLLDSAEFEVRGHGGREGSGGTVRPKQ